MPTKNGPNLVLALITTPYSMSRSHEARKLWTLNGIQTGVLQPSAFSLQSMGTLVQTSNYNPFVLLDEMARGPFALLCLESHVDALPPLIMPAPN